jgi:prepilin-type N-terminal cleavage/methylation domain-containing protein
MSNRQPAGHSGLIGAPVRRSAFSLVEMLVVIALVATLTVLLAPSIQSLMGVTGRRGGMSILAGALDQARIKAIESGQTVHLGFPFEAVDDEELARSHFILFRAAAEGDGTGIEFVPIGRWSRLPSGVYMQGGANFPVQELEIPGGNLPQLDGNDVTRLQVLSFDRFGALRGAAGPVEINVGEKVRPNDEGWLRADNNYFTLAVQRLTGRVEVRDNSENN